MSKRILLLVTALLCLGAFVMLEPVTQARPKCPTPPCKPVPTTTTAVPTTSTSATSTSTTSTSTTSTSTTVPVTTTTAATTTTTVPAGGMFVEDFASVTALQDRFDYKWAGEWNAGAAWGGNRNDWHGDHDLACGNPNLTHRTIHLTGQAQATEAAFFPCNFPGDAAKSHLMTTVNTEGYVTAWFSPKQTFSNVHRVCWDQTLNWQGGGRWVVVNFLTATEIGSNPDLGFTSPDFPDEGGGASSTRGEAAYGVKVFDGGMNSYSNKVFHGGPGGVAKMTDKATRYTLCVLDNENGTLTLSMETPSNGTVSQTVTGAIPNSPIRVEFADDAYNPDKHCGWDPICVGHDAGGAVPDDSTGLYTWHWDQIVIQ